MSKPAAVLGGVECDVCHGEATIMVNGVWKCWKHVPPSATYREWPPPETNEQRLAREAEHERKRVRRAKWDRARELAYYARLDRGRDALVAALGQRWADWYDEQRREEGYADY